MGEISLPHWGKSLFVIGIPPAKICNYLLFSALSESLSKKSFPFFIGTPSYEPALVRFDFAQL